MYTLGQVNGRDTLSIMPLTLSKTRFLTHTHLALVCVGTLCDLEDENSVVTLSLSLSGKASTWMWGMTEATVTVAPARTSTSVMHASSMSSEPSATGTRTFFSDMLRLILTFVVELLKSRNIVPFSRRVGEDA